VEDEAGWERAWSDLSDGFSFELRSKELWRRRNGEKRQKR
jgi:hypothetical protein